jgi:hypothetical protein
MEAAKKPTPIAIIAKSSMANYLSKAPQALETVPRACLASAVVDGIDADQTMLTPNAHSPEPR